MAPLDAGRTAAPRVSVVVPVHDGGGIVRQAVASALGQRWDDLEVFVTDDGSRDSRTLAALEDVARDPRVRVHHQPNAGPAAARNAAIVRAVGDYILPLDADDLLHPEFLARTLPVLDTNPAAGIAYTWVGLRGSHHGVWRTGGASVPELLVGNTLHVTALYRRAVWESVGGYDPAFVEGGEDWDFWLSAAARGWEATGVPEVLAYYRRSSTGRETRARAPGQSAAVARRLVAKHRALYEAHLEEAVAGLYERVARLALQLDRHYAHPAMRAWLWVRRLVRREQTR